jgi:hypothetical protein
MKVFTTIHFVLLFQFCIIYPVALSAQTADDVVKRKPIECEDELMCKCLDMQMNLNRIG